MIGREAVLESLSSKPVECVTVNSDRRATKQAKLSLQTQHMVCVQMHKFEEDFEELLPQEQMQVCNILFTLYCIWWIGDSLEWCVNRL